MQFGRVPIDAPKVTGHGRPVLDIEWNPFNDQEIASSSEDGSIKVWHVPEDGLSMDLDEYLVDLRGHTRKVNIIRWHPCAEGVIASAAYDSEVRIWDIVDDREAATILKGHPDIIFSLSFNYNGSLLASTCKDKKIRVIDPRAGKLVAVSFVDQFLTDYCSIHQYTLELKQLAFVMVINVASHLWVEFQLNTLFLFLRALILTESRIETRGRSAVD